MKATNIELEGIDTGDYPDFCDAFIAYAEHEDGTPFTEAELDVLNMDTDLIHEQVFEQLN
jgi:hypothetical protein